MIIEESIKEIIEESVEMYTKKYYKKFNDLLKSYGITEGIDEAFNKMLHPKIETFYFTDNTNRDLQFKELTIKPNNNEYLWVNNENKVVPVNKSDLGKFYNTYLSDQREVFVKELPTLCSNIRNYIFKNGIEERWINFYVHVQDGQILIYSNEIKISYKENDYDISFKMNYDKL